MGAASSTLFRELWGEETLNSLKRKQKEVQRVFNGITDYTMKVKDVKSAGYHGPKFSGLSGETVSRGNSFDSVQSADNSSIDIAFDQKSGGAYDIKLDQAGQTPVELAKEYGDEMAEEIMDEYDEYILTQLIGNCADANKVDFAGAGSNADVITAADFIKARKTLNLAGAPQRGRYCFIDPKHESELYSISNFVSRDKIAKTEALKEGVVGRLLGFDVILTTNMPQVDIAGDINATTAKNDSYPVLFVQSLAYGWGRQKEFATMQSNDAKATTTDYSLWSMHGGALQEDDYILQISDQTTADPS
jgi:hypothetical protein